MKREIREAVWVEGESTDLLTALATARAKINQLRREDRWDHRATV